VLFGRESLAPQLLQGAFALLQRVKAHRVEDLGRFRKLDVRVLDDLDAVAPRVAEVEAAAREDLGTGLLERPSGRVLVVHDEPEVAVLVGFLAAAFGQGDELVAHVDERHAGNAAAELEVENTPVEGEGVVDVAHLEGDVVHADETRLGHVRESCLTGTSRQWIH
jgi:hypothetical protein